VVVRFAAVAVNFGDGDAPYPGVPVARHRRRSSTANRTSAASRLAASSHAGSELNRRKFLGSLAAATVAGVGVARLIVDPQPRTLAEAPSASAAAPGPAAPGMLLPPPPRSARIPLPGGGALSTIPGDGDLLALTLDDGVNSDVVRAYIQLAKDTGARMTFFVNGIYDAWTDHRAMLRPLVDSGQIQLGNHTWSHPDLTTLPASEISQELSRNDEFLKKNYGIGAKPYYRPPYAKHNASVDAVAEYHGYQVPTLWSGSLSDSTLIHEDYIVKMADQYFTPQSIVIGHLNHLPVTHVYPQLIDIIRSRNLRTVTLNDVFLKTP
jgi:peptidoglycan-N-acetylglucosamine deacetylase